MPAFQSLLTHQLMSRWPLCYKGSPLWLAGGVVMRLAKEGDDSQSVYDMDFPMLTGEPYRAFFE